MKNKRKINYWILGLILLVGVGLRFYKLNEIPKVVNRDEAALGYNAYSIIETGKDEFNRTFPLTFASFGDYKLPLYSYASIPFIKIFGLNNYSIRTLSAIWGSFLILITYFLTFELLKSKKAALWAASGISFSPWAVFYSRIAFETNVAAGLFALSMLFLLKGKKRPWLWIIASLTLILALFTYNSPYIVGPIMLMVFVIFEGKKLFLNHRRKYVLISFAILLIGSLSTLGNVWEVNTAKSQITIFKNEEIRQEMARFITDHKEYQGRQLAKITELLSAKIFDNRYLFYLNRLSTNVLKNFSAEYLITRDFNHIWNGIPGIGHFYVIDYIVLMVGVFALVREKDKFIKFFILTWLVSSVLPAALTIHEVQPNRGLLSFVIIYPLIGLGLTYIIKSYDKRKFLITIGLIGVYVWNWMFFVDRYFVHFPKNYVGWYDNLGQVVMDINNEKADLIMLSANIEEVYIYYLFYSQYSPEDFQKTVIRTKDANGFYEVHGFGKVKIGHLEDSQIEDELKEHKKVLVMGRASDAIFSSVDNFDGFYESAGYADLSYKIYE